MACVEAQASEYDVSFVVIIVPIIIVSVNNFFTLFAQSEQKFTGHHKNFQKCDIFC